MASSLSILSSYSSSPTCEQRGGRPGQLRAPSSCSRCASGAARGGGQTHGVAVVSDCLLVADLAVPVLILVVSPASVMVIHLLIGRELRHNSSLQRRKLPHTAVAGRRSPRPSRNPSFELKGIGRLLCLYNWVDVRVPCFMTLSAASIGSPIQLHWSSSEAQLPPAAELPVAVRQAAGALGRAAVVGAAVIALGTTVRGPAEGVACHQRRALRAV